MDLYCLKDRLIWCQQGKETWRKQKSLPFYVLDSEQVGECSLFMLSKNTLVRLKGTALLPVPGCLHGCLHTHTPWARVAKHIQALHFNSLNCTCADSTLHILPLWKRGKAAWQKSLLRYRSTPERSKMFLQESRTLKYWLMTRENLELKIGIIDKHILEQTEIKNYD